MSERAIGTTWYPIGLAAILAVVLVAVAALTTFYLFGGSMAEQQEQRAELAVHRTEVVFNVDAVRVAQITYQDVFGDFVACSSASEARAEVTMQRHPFVDKPCWRTLSWLPDDVRGAYWVEVQGEDFTVHGVIDVDGDGTFAEATATKATQARLVTAETIF